MRAVGSDLRMDYTAVGQTTHLAARMEQLAPPGTVRLTAETVRLAEGYVEVRSLGPILLANRMDEATRAAHEALAPCRERKLRGTEAWCLRLLGEIASHRGPPDIESAEQHYHQGLALAAEVGMRPLVAHCHLGLGKLSRRTGNRVQAQEHLATARTMYRKMDMRFWLKQAEAEISGLAS